MSIQETFVQRTMKKILAPGRPSEQKSAEPLEKAKPTPAIFCSFRFPSPTKMMSSCPARSHLSLTLTSLAGRQQLPLAKRHRLSGRKAGGKLQGHRTAGHGEVRHLQDLGGPLSLLCSLLSALLEGIQSETLSKIRKIRLDAGNKPTSGVAAKNKLETTRPPQTPRSSPTTKSFTPKPFSTTSCSS